jgi:hypothetical protein
MGLLMDKFKLSETFIDTFKTKQPPFGFNGLGELAYMQAYSRLKADGSNEQWWETCRRVVEGTYNMQKNHIEKYNCGWNPWQAQRSAQEMYTRMFYMKFLPPGRGLWAMGSPITEERGLYAALNNCFSGEETFITKEYGVVSFAEVVNSTVSVLTRKGWIPAKIHSFGKQRTQRVTFVPAMPNSNGKDWRKMRTNHRIDIVVTPNHRWITIDDKETTSLTVGDVVKSHVNIFVDKESTSYKDGFHHGLVFGDGALTYTAKNHFSHQLRLCGEKTKNYVDMFENVTYPKFANGDTVAHINSEHNFKEYPQEDSSPDYISGFLDGWIAADGTQKADDSFLLCSQRSDAVTWLKKFAALAGYVITGINVDSVEETNYGIRSNPVNRITLSRSRNIAWKVSNIEPLEEVEVYCANVPEEHSFTLTSGIYTGNCAFVSTKNLKEDLSKPFLFLMDMSMCGVGVAFDTKGAGQIIVKEPNTKRQPEIYKVPDTREGWVESLKLLLESYFLSTAVVQFDYSLIRKEGEPMRGFGGVSSGYKPLEDMHKAIKAVLEKEKGSPISVTAIVDIMNLIGKAVVSGNIRRSAELALGDSDSIEYLDLKDYKKNPHRETYGWTSNNSVVVKNGSSYAPICERIKNNGEPGLIWLENMRQYSRIDGMPDGKDIRADGTNPCAEQVLESYELCCLVETFPFRHDTLEDYLVTLKYAYLYAKTVTLGSTHWAETNRVMLRNRRIGCSVSGVAQFITHRGIETLRKWLTTGYDAIQKWDKVYSEWFAIPRSIKTTSVKPSGCRPWDALTSTGQGILTLEELFEQHKEEEIWATCKGYTAIQENNTEEQITKTYVNGKAPVYKILCNYNIELRSTGNHLWRVKKNYKNKEYSDVNTWKRTDELTPEDVLEIVPGVYDRVSPVYLKKVNSISFKMRTDAKDILQPEVLTPDLAWFFGYLWGDGAMSPSKFRIRFIDGRLDNLKKAQNIVKEYFGLDSVIHKAFQHRKAWILDISSKLLWHWFIRNNVFKYYNDKLSFIPQVVRQGSAEIIIAFIAGLIDADGCVSARERSNVVVLSTADEEFARHVQDISLAVGIVFSRSHNTQGYNLQKQKSMWLLTSMPESRMDRFMLLKKHSVKMQDYNMKSPNLPWNCELDSYRILGRVENVSLIGEMNTYDIEVANSHWYYAGAVKSHNTVSLLAGATPGIHYPESRYYIRRIRLNNTSELIAPLKKAGYHIEPCYGAESTTVVVEIPVDVGEGIRSVAEVSMWEQLSLAAFMQKYWSDNSVSATITFDPKTEGDQLRYALDYFQYQLKGVSFLPRYESKAYRQMPYEAIDEKTYKAKMKKLGKLKLGRIRGEEVVVEKFCNNDTCEITS